MGRSIIYIARYKLSLFSVSGVCDICPTVVLVSCSAFTPASVDSADSWKDILSTRQCIDAADSVPFVCPGHDQCGGIAESTSIARTGIFRTCAACLGDARDWPGILFCCDM